MKKTLLLLICICLSNLCCQAQHDGFSADTLSDAVFARMQGRSFPKDCTVSRSDLRYLKVKHYDADDERSMTANNTSCFCFRKIAGSQRLSKHSLGMAIDINPLHNPCVSKRRDGSTLIQPAAGKKYADRSKKYAYKITKGDLCYRLFKEHGFSWGGDWRSKKDYQHFEKE